MSNQDIKYLHSYGIEYTSSQNSLDNLNICPLTEQFCSENTPEYFYRLFGSGLKMYFLLIIILKVKLIIVYYLKKIFRVGNKGYRYVSLILTYLVRYPHTTLYKVSMEMSIYNFPELFTVTSVKFFSE